MQKINSLKAVKDIFDLLVKNQYNLVWSLIDDFECNGHIVSIKNRPAWAGIIIDDCVVDIGDYMITYADGHEFRGREYAMYLLNDRKL